MDNGALVFIIIIEAVVIVWLASKLTQYQKFEKLLDPADRATKKAVADSNSQTAAGEPIAESATANATAASAASSAVAGALRSNNDVEAELLDMPGVDPEANIEEAKRVQLVMARCRYAEFYLEQLDDEYERGQFQQIITSCINTARNITDPFFQSSALEPVIFLLDKAEWHEQRDQLLSEVADELVRERIDAELDAQLSG